MVPVAVKINWSVFTVCGHCARQMGKIARQEQRGRRLESGAVRGKKGQGQ